MDNRYFEGNGNFFMGNRRCKKNNLAMNKSLIWGRYAI